MKPEIKICGLKTPEAVDTALRCGASHIGFIFFAKSPRNVSAETAAGLRERAAGRAKAVAVTVNAGDDELREIVDTLRPDVLQLHGSETPERVAELKQRFGLPIMKAFALREQGDLEPAEAYRGITDLFLFDAKPPDGSELPGGNGVAFDWRLLRALDRDVKYMLSGGLNAANVGDALAQVQPPAIDVSSGVERTPGVKDTTLIEDFFKSVRAAMPAAGPDAQPRG